MAPACPGAPDPGSTSRTASHRALRSATTRTPPARTSSEPRSADERRRAPRAGVRHATHGGPSPMFATASLHRGLLGALPTTLWVALSVGAAAIHFAVIPDHLV